MSVAEEGHTRLRNRGNQTDSNDATWIWVNPTILPYTVATDLIGTMHLKGHLFQCETCIIMEFV